MLQIEHLYSYCANDPINYTDPTGHMMRRDAEDGGSTPDPLQTYIDNRVKLGGGSGSSSGNGGTSKDEANKYLNGGMLGLGVYNSDQMQNIPHTLTYVDKGYTYKYELSAISSSFFGVNLGPMEKSTTSDGRIIDYNLYGYNCVYSDEPKPLLGIIIVSPSSKWVGKADGMSELDFQRLGRSGKQARLKKLANDDKLSSSIRGEIKRDINEIALGKRKNIRVPKGYNLAHRRGFEAKNGYGYEYSDLQDIRLHKLQHKVEGY